MKNVLDLGGEHKYSMSDWSGDSRGNRLKNPGSLLPTQAASGG